LLYKINFVKESQNLPVHKIEQLSAEIRKLKKDKIESQAQIKLIRSKLNSRDQQFLRERIVCDANMKTKITMLESEWSSKIQLIKEENQQNNIKFLSSICSFFLEDLDLGKPMTPEGVLKLLHEISQRLKNVKLIEKRYENYRNQFKTLRHLLEVEKNDQIFYVIRSLKFSKSECN
jgi:hypothetical protein